MSKYCAARVNSENRAAVKRFYQMLEQHPDNLDLTGLKTDPSIFPTKELKTAAEYILDTMGAEALQYSSSHDYLPLKAVLAERYNAFGLQLADENFTVTNGSAQAVDMLMKVLVNEGDTILVEAPISWRVRQTMSMYRPNVIDIPVTPEGIDLEALETAMRDNQPKFFYCTPNLQEPTGVIYTLENRKQIAALAKKYDCIVVEQDTASELLPDKERLPYIFAELDGLGILIGSISRLVGPGLRLGWVACTHPVLMKYFTDAKQKTDSHCNGLIQRVLWRCLSENGVCGQAEKVRAVYAEKRAAAEKAAAVLRECAEVTPVHEGGFLWVTLPEQMSGSLFAMKAAQAGISVVPGEFFGRCEICARSIYVNYSGLPTEQIETAFAGIAELIRA